MLKTLTLRLCVACWASWACGAAFAQTAPPQRAPELSARETQPLALFLNTPTSARSSVGLSQVLEQLAQRLRRHTDLEPVQLGREVFSGCVGRLSCILSRAESSAARFLMIVTLFPGESQDGLTVLLADRSRAQRCRGDPEQCASKAVVFRDGPRSIADVQSLAKNWDRLFEGPLQRAFEAAGRWEPFGQIELTSDLSGASIKLDGRLLGVSQTGPQRLKDVRAGAHEVVLELPDGQTSAQKVQLQRGETKRLSFSLAPPRTWVRQSVLYTGAALAGLGAALTAWAIAYSAQHSSLLTYCQGGCSGGRFWTLEQMASGAPSEGDEFPNPGRVKALPLGYSLILGGGLIALITSLWIEEEQSLWIPTVAGVVAGSLAYGISAAAD